MGSDTSPQPTQPGYTNATIRSGLSHRTIRDDMLLLKLRETSKRVVILTGGD